MFASILGKHRQEGGSARRGGHGCSETVGMGRDTGRAGHPEPGRRVQEAVKSATVPITPTVTLHEVWVPLHVLDELWATHYQPSLRENESGMKVFSLPPTLSICIMG